MNWSLHLFFPLRFSWGISLTNFHKYVHFYLCDRKLKKVARIHAVTFPSNWSGQIKTNQLKNRLCEKWERELQAVVNWECDSNYFNFRKTKNDHRVHTYYQAWKVRYHWGSKSTTCALLCQRPSKLAANVPYLISVR